MKYPLIAAHGLMSSEYFPIMISDDEGGHVASVVAYDEVISDTEASDQTKAHAQRIIDCVNACKDLDDPKTLIPQMIEFFKKSQTDIPVVRLMELARPIIDKIDKPNKIDWDKPIEYVTGSRVYPATLLHRNYRVNRDITAFMVMIHYDINDTILYFNKEGHQRDTQTYVRNVK